MTLFVALALSATSFAPAPRQDGGEPHQDETGPPPIEAPPLCPEPLLFEPRWAPVELTLEGRIVATDEALRPLAEVLAADLAAVTGVTLAVAGVPARSGDIVLTLGYLPEELRQNPEAFFIETFDHVLVSGETVDGLARGTARLLQLTQPIPGEGSGTAPRGIHVPAARFVDAPSVRWRAMAVDAEDLVDGLEPTAAEGSTQQLDHVVARAHLAGYNALVFRDAAGEPSREALVQMATRHLAREAERRRVTLVLGVLDERATGLRGGVSAARVHDFTPKELGSLGGRLERGDCDLLCARAPFHGPLAPLALGPDEATTARRMTRFLFPILPVGRAADAPAMLGELYGRRTSLAAEVALPAAWAERAPAPPEASPAPRAAEAWHGGMRADSLRGAPELERVLLRVTAALTRRG